MNCLKCLATDSQIFPIIKICESVAILKTKNVQ